LPIPAGIGENTREIAITGKPVSYGICVNGINPGFTTDP
jgi:NAD(P)-dependent dehydrogenase (short-subunit alcohol dehydrogenase family)